MKKKELSRIRNLLDSEIPKIISQSKGNVEFHNNLRKYLSMIAVKFDYNGKTRYKMSNKKHIDVVWYNDTGDIKWAIQIDGGQRKRSLKCLSDVIADNKIWIYYGNNKDLLKKNNLSNTFLILNLGNIRKELREKNEINKFG